MSRFGGLYRGDTHIEFVAQRNRWFRVSAIALVLCVLSLGVRQLNLSLDFRGGLALESPNPIGATVGDVRDALAPFGLSDARVLEIDDGASIRVQTEAVDVDTERLLVDAVTAATGATVDETNLESVGPTFGAEIARRAVLALVVFLVVTVLFISVRFEWKMAMAALAALFHDLLLTFGAYSLLGFEVTPATVVAILTILGYSLYDTVVVFDKINENVVEYGDKMTYSGIVDLSMNQVLMRSINTSLTSLLPVGSLLFVGSLLLGAGTLRDFALALFVGIAAGTYSSIFIASPFLAWWKEKEEEWERRAYRVERKSGPEKKPKVVKPAPAEPAAARQPKRLSSEGQRTGESGATPRPPKKKKRR
jgi:preprotein translocase subunit SecF